jgi:hypothetical protein
VVAAEQLRRATDPDVRRALEQVVRDETEHAELAWACLRWALDDGGEEVRERLRTAFIRPSDPARVLSISVPEDGVPPQAQVPAVGGACW